MSGCFTLKSAFVAVVADVPACAQGVAADQAINPTSAQGHSGRQEQGQTFATVFSLPLQQIACFNHVMRKDCHGLMH